MPRPAAATAVSAKVQRVLSAKQLQARLRRLGVKPGCFAVALSGGPDSLALAALLAQLGPLHAFIVDHGLRPEAPAEARHVKRMAQALGIKTHILKWQGDKPATGIMEAARHARYRLLATAAQKYKCTHLLIGHHQDDQIETVKMRQQSGSGWQGLAGMPVLSQLGAVTLVRPLLNVSKAQLVATCAALGLEPVDDPSNHNTRYTRVRVRHEAKDSKALLALQQKSAAKRQALLDKIRSLEGKAYGLHEGWTSYQRRFMSVGMLRLLLQHAGQEDKPIRQEALEQALARLRAGQGATLAGCIIRDGLIVREPSAIAPINLPPGRHTLEWDRRWQLGFVLKEAHVLAPLGKNGNWRSLKGSGWLESLPGAARASVPALWQGGRLVAVLKGRWQPYYCPMKQQFEEK